MTSIDGLLWRILPLLFMTASSLCWAKTKASFSGSFDGRIAYHTTAPQNLASHRQMLGLEQKITYSPEWSGIFAGRAWNESAYASQPNQYPSSLSKEDSQEFDLRDFYLQYQSDHWQLRLGNQQVVWGEAFGFFYSDIVNPKDFRDGGFGSLESVRRDIPMVNAKYISDNFSLQGIYVVKPYFDQNPLPGSDFAFPYSTYAGVQQVVVEREDSADMRIGNEELGGRASYLLGHLDISAFYFSYLDRQPYYIVDSGTNLPQQLVLKEQHSRVESTGGTATYDLEGYLLRLEALQTKNRSLPLIETKAGVPSLSRFTTAENIYVTGLDFPTWQKLTLGLQWSESYLSDYQSGLLRPRHESLLSARVSRPIYREQTLEMIYSYAPHDYSQRLQLEYTWPASEALEFKFGADALEGSPTSQFGGIRRGSRAYAALRVWFKG